MLRDAYGVNVGTVKPGDVLEFDQAPDADWVPYEASGDERGGIESDPDPADVRSGPAGSEQDHDDTAGDGQEEG